MWGVLALVAIAACGRIDFDAVGSGGVPPSGDVGQLAVGLQDACVRSSDGALYCWGLNDAGQLGLGAARVGTDVNLPERVGAATRWTDIALGQHHSCALDDHSAAWCWGDNQYGQLGLGTLTPMPDPTPVGDNRAYIHIFADTYQTCAIATDHTLWCWGRNGAQELGVGDNTDRKTPEQVLIVAPQVGADDDWTNVAVGDDHTCAIKLDKSLWCWGANASGELGQAGNSMIVRNRPEVVMAGSTWAVGGAGQDYECVIADGRQVYCLGRNDAYQLGVGDTTARDVPAMTAAGSFIALGVGQAHACAVRDDHTLMCWGDNTSGAIGIGTNGGTQQMPANIAGSWFAVHAGNAFTCALDAGLGAWCWGNGANGRLGNGSNTGSLRPAPVQFGT